MSRISLGDASMTNILARQGADLRAQVSRASQEVTTGRYADIGQALRGDYSPLLAVDASLARLQSYASTTTEAASLTAAQQAALGSIGAHVSEATGSLLRASDFTTAAQVDMIAADVHNKLAGVIGLLNSQVAGRSAFAGVATDTAPLGQTEDLLTALATAAAGATTAGQVVSAVTTWFNDPGGFQAFYQGGTPLAPVAIAPGESADLSTTALDPAIRETLAGFAMAALLDRGVLSGLHDERALLAQRGGEALLSSGEGRIALAARIGSVEAQIEDARTRNSTEATALGILRSDTGSVDPYEASTRLENARAQLESLYLVTARVSRLSLVEFLS
jgi:flagellar hook-associated protein 3 FlgL